MEQLRQMAQAQHQSFVERMVQHITDDLPCQYRATCLDRQSITGFVQVQIATARAYGIVNARDLKSYIDSAVVFGTDFNTDPSLSWARATLNRTDLDGSAKAEALYEYLTFIGLNEFSPTEAAT